MLGFFCPVASPGSRKLPLRLVTLAIIRLGFYTMQFHRKVQGKKTIQPKWWSKMMIQNDEIIYRMSRLIQFYNQWWDWLVPSGWIGPVLFAMLGSNDYERLCFFWSTAKNPKLGWLLTPGLWLSVKLARVQYSQIWLCLKLGYLTRSHSWSSFSPFTKHWSFPIYGGYPYIIYFRLGFSMK